jgi:membrane associated rhomboid family serine protease
VDADTTYRSGASQGFPGRPGTRSRGAELWERLRILLGFVALIWLVELVDLILFRGALDGAGIRPRSENGLWGVILAPFLHAGPAHLIANTVPLLVLGWLVIVRGVRDFLGVTLLVTLVAGLGVWIFGRPATIHLGASGLVFGYLGYLLLRGFWERSLLAVGIALVAGFLYGGALLGVLPGQRGVSWEGHLFGLAGGAGAASVHRRRESQASGPTLYRSAVPR